MINKLFNKKYFTFYLITFFIFVSFIFLTKSFYNATTEFSGNSKDLQQWYQLSKLFWEKNDIFELHFLNRKYPFLGYFKSMEYWPMWNHLIYIAFLPYTLFSFNVAKILWFFSNLIFTFLTIRLLKKIYSLSLNRSLILAIVTISSTPFTNTLGVGQIGMLLLLCIIIYWFSKNKFEECFLSAAVIKLSFAPFLILNSFFKKETALIYAILISTLAVLFYAFYVNNFNLYQFINPLIIIYKENSRMETFTGMSNLKTMFMILELEKFYLIGFLFFITVIVINIFFSKKDSVLFLTIVLASLFAFYHNLYDFVFLIPLVAYLLKPNISKIIIIIHLPVVIWFFYFIRFNQLILKNFLSDNTVSLIGSFLIIISISGFLFQKYFVKNLK